MSHAVFCYHCSTAHLRRPHVQASLFLIVVCELPKSLLVLIIKVVSVVTVINLDPCLILCHAGSLNWGELGLESPWILCLRRCGNRVMFLESVLNLPQENLWSIKFTEHDWLFRSWNNFTVGYIKCQPSTSLRYDLRDVEGQCLTPHQQTYHSSPS